MKRLLKIVLFKHQHRFLLILTLIGMCLLTIASQLEILTIGLITKKGPEFFELFAPIEEGALVQANLVTKAQLDSRFQDLDSLDKGFVSRSDVTKFMEKVQNKNFIETVMTFIENKFSVTANVFYLAILVIMVALFKAIMMFVYRFSTRLISIRLSCDLRQDYFEHMQSLSMNFYQQHNMGGLSARVVGDASVISEAVNACLVNYIQTPFTVVTTLTLCFLTSWQLSLMIFLGFPLIMGPIIFLAKRVKKVSQQLQKNQEAFSSALLDFLGGIQTIKIFGMESFSLRKYKEQNHYMALLEKKSARYDLSTRPIVHTIGMMFLSGALLYGLYILHMDVSEVFFYCGMLYIFYEPIKKFAEENGRIQRGVAAAERMFEVLDLKPQVTDIKAALTLQEMQSSIEYKQVDFRYENQLILKNFSMKIKKGESVALVGPTGGGKSTIVQLLARLYEVEQGEICIDGIPINTYSQASLRESMAFVPQKPFLFLDTVAQNIAFGRSYTREQVIKAAKRAHADEFIVNLPQGYDTLVAEGGKNLSGGQQQRLAIARALIRNASILIMDEATSALDALSENLIKKAIDELHGQVTQIIIAHRFSTIENVDRIIYLDKGKKIAEGTNEEMLKNCAGFKAMWDAYTHA